MAHSDTPPPEALKALAGQLTRRVAPGRVPPGARAVFRPPLAAELTEHFTVWALSVDALQRPGDKLADLATQTDRWHHQLRVDGKSESFARSKPGVAGGDWELMEVFRTEVAAAIDRGITWIDDNVRGDPLVRLLV